MWLYCLDNLFVSNFLLPLRLYALTIRTFSVLPAPTLTRSRCTCTPPDRCDDLRHPAGQASKKPLACPASRVSISPGQRETRARLPPVPSFAAASLLRGPVPPGQQKAARLASPTGSRTARPGKSPPGLRRAKRPAAAVLPAADVPPATHPRCRSPAPAPGCPPLQQKQRRFGHLAFPGWTAAIAPAVATRSSRIRALKFGLSEPVDRSIPGCQ